MTGITAPTFRHVLITAERPAHALPALQAARSALQGWTIERVTLLLADRSAPAADPHAIGWAVAALGLPWEAREMIVQRAGDPAEEAARHAEEDPCDLLVTLENGMSTQRLVRRAPCSLLILPSGPPPSCGSVLAAVDFSPDSRRAVSFARELAGLHDRVVELLHVFSEPPGYRKLRLSRRQLIALLKSHALHDMKTFVDSLPLSHRRMTSRVLFGDHPAQTLLREARSGRYAHIVLASRRRSALLAVLLGSVAERIALSAPLPVWIVRDERPLRVLDSMRSGRNG